MSDLHAITSRVCDTLPGNEHVEHWMLLDVLYCLLVGNHGEVVAIHL